MSLYVEFTGVAGDYASTPDAAALDLTGDLDIRVQIAPDDWAATSNYEGFVSKRLGSSGEYLFGFDTGDRIRLVRWNGSTAKSWICGTDPNTVFTGSEWGWLRVTQDVDNGSTQHVTEFFTSSDGTNWTQLGATDTDTGVYSATATTNQVLVGAALTTDQVYDGFLRRAEIRDGIDGTLVASFNANDAPNAAATSWDSLGTGETWTLAGNAALAGSKSATVDRIAPYLHALGDL